MAVATNKTGNHANLGKPFEELINYANAQYRARKIAVIKQNPTKWIPLRGQNGKIVSAKVEEKAIVDFDGCWKSYYIAFDAKHTQNDRISLKAVEPNQIEYLNDCAHHPNGICFILVSFSLQYFFTVPWDFWRERLEQFEKHKKRGTGSLAICEMRVEWEVVQGNGIVLDYLRGLEYW